MVRRTRAVLQRSVVLGGLLTLTLAAAPVAPGQQALHPPVHPLAQGRHYRLTLSGGHVVIATVESVRADAYIVKTSQGTIQIPSSRIMSATEIPSLQPAPRPSASQEAQPGRPLVIGPQARQEEGVLEAAKCGELGNALAACVEGVLPRSTAQAWALASRAVFIAADSADNGTTVSDPVRQTDLAIRSYEVFVPKADPDQLTSTSLRLAAWMARLQQVERIETLARLLDTVHPDGAALIHHVAEYHRRLNAMASGDFLAAYRLGRWAAQRGLNQQARELMILCAGHPDLGPNARLQLEVLDRQTALESLRRVRDAATGQSTALLRRAVEQFQADHPDSPYIRHLWQMSEVQRLSNQRAVDAANLSGEAALQEMERLDRAGDYPALAILSKKVQAESVNPAIAAAAIRYEVKATARLLPGERPGLPASFEVAAPDAPAVPASSPAPPAPVDRMSEIEAMARDAARRARREIPGAD